MLKLIPTSEMEKVLSLAQEEIYQALVDPKTVPPDSVPISDLIDQLDRLFSPISDQIYATAMDDDTRTSILKISLSDRVPLPGIDSFFDDVVPAPPRVDKKRFLHPYPTVYLERLIYVQQQNTMTILPYILAAYYIHFRTNRAIGSAMGSHKIVEGSEENALFHSAGIADNFERTARNYSKKFSLETMVTRYSSRKDLVEYSSADGEISKEDIEHYLEHAPRSVLHYRSLLYTWVYAACAYCCTRIPELSKKIDYVLATDLFYAHTLAFAVAWPEENGIPISCFFSDEDPEFFVTPLMEEVEKRLSEMEVNREEYCLPLAHTTADVYKSALLTLAALLRPDQDVLFRSSEFLDSLMRKGYSKLLDNCLQLFDED